MKEPYIDFYAYDAETGEYLGVAPGYLDPLESTQENPVYNTPAFAVAVSPVGELQKNRSYRINAARDGWDIVPDYRHVRVWTIGTRTLAPPLAYGDALPDALTTAEPPTPSEFETVEWDAKARVWIIVPDYTGVMLRSKSTGDVARPLSRGQALPEDLTAVPWPPLNAKETALWVDNDSAWRVIPDHRGELWFNKMTGEPTLVTLVGAVPTTLTPVPPPTAYHTWSGDGWHLSDENKSRLDSQAERVWRDSEISKTSWLRERHRDELDAGLPTTLTVAQFSELVAYVRALRDWPAHELFPDQLRRPPQPAWLSR